MLQIFAYYARDAAWAWETVWDYASNRILWGVSVSLVGATISALTGYKLGGALRPALIGGAIGALGGPIIVILLGFLINFVRYPAIQDEHLRLLESENTSGFGVYEVEKIHNPSGRIGAPSDVSRYVWPAPGLDDTCLN